MRRKSNEALVVLMAVTTFFFLASAFPWEKSEDEGDECLTRFISETRWLNSDKEGCISDCLASQDLGMANFSCDYTQDCEKFCRKAKPVKRDAMDCKDIQRPGIFRRLWIWPKNPFNVAISYFAAKRARRLTAELYPSVLRDGEVCTSAHNGKGDAFRHCYWNCLMTYLFGLDPGLAMDYSSWLEYMNPGPCEETLMDLNNNKVGTEIAMSGGNCLNDCQTSENLQILGDEECYPTNGR